MLTDCEALSGAWCRLCPTRTNASGGLRCVIPSSMRSMRAELGCLLYVSEDRPGNVVDKPAAVHIRQGQCVSQVLRFSQSCSEEKEESQSLARDDSSVDRATGGSFRSLCDSWIASFFSYKNRTNRRQTGRTCALFAMAVRPRPLANFVRKSEPASRSGSTSIDNPRDALRLCSR